jgi:hypothetical protein
LELDCLLGWIRDRSAGSCVNNRWDRGAMVMRDELKDKITDELLAHAIFSHRGTAMNRAYAMDAAASVLLVIEEAGYSMVRDLPLCGDSRRTPKTGVNNDKASGT